MKIEDQSPKDDQKKEIKKSSGSILNKLIFVICCSVITFVGANFVSCNFMVPGTITYSNVLGGLKNPPPSDCNESQKRGYDTLLTILTTVIALRTKVED